MLSTTSERGRFCLHVLRNGEKLTEVLLSPNPSGKVTDVDRFQQIPWNTSVLSMLLIYYVTCTYNEWVYKVNFSIFVIDVILYPNIISLFITNSRTAKSILMKIGREVA
ncbi:unnamed protein product [Spodoptera littoralis]|uniref:Uncharacterized protein n=1 Tax=Spodoptera littoralis TaxID=7109 RepID=A0A9P0ICH2_SPOLI|nr:unnamed protein product [Spodoptera littoralis]CAH1645070.1 unnamed protein product [Spodoptera littoralis]